MTLLIQLPVLENHIKVGQASPTSSLSWKPLIDESPERTGWGGQKLEVEAAGRAGGVYLSV